MEEMWQPILGFENYEISNFGRCVNTDTGHVLTLQLSTGYTGTYFLMKDRKAHGRSARLLVAQAFLPRENWWDKDPEVFDTPILLDYNPRNCRVDNMVWRPRWFAVQWARQERWMEFPQFQIPIVNVTTGDSYNSIVEACLTEGKLLRDVYNSAGELRGGTHPDGSVFRFHGDEHLYYHS